MRLGPYRHGRYVLVLWSPLEINIHADPEHRLVYNVEIEWLWRIGRHVGHFTGTAFVQLGPVDLRRMPRRSG
jgi:hypothetical protein